MPDETLVIDLTEGSIDLKVEHHDPRPGVSTSPAHDNQTAEPLATIEPRDTTTQMRKTVFTFLGPFEEDFTPEGPHPGAELFAKAREFFGNDDVNTLYCLRVCDSRLKQLKAGYIGEVDRFVDRMEELAKYNRIVIWVRDNPFNS